MNHQQALDLPLGEYLEWRGADILSKAEENRAIRFLFSSVESVTYMQMQWEINWLRNRVKKLEEKLCMQ